MALRQGQRPKERIVAMALPRPLRFSRTAFARARSAALTVAVLVAAVLLSLPANAFIDPPIIVPARPVAGQVVSFDVRIGVCEYFQAFGPSDGMTVFSDDRWRSIVRVGNTLQVTVRTAFASEPILCVYPTANFRFRLGDLTPGNYTLEVYGQDVDIPASRPLIGSVGFVVGSAPAAVPVMTGPWILLLVVGASVFGFAALRGES
jgi:hypothetical protein